MNLPDAIKTILPRAPFDMTTALAAAMEQWQIQTPDRAAAFIAQVGVESNELTATREDLYYSAEALLRVWPIHFPTMEIATQYAYRPRPIANRAYADRMGNGDEASGDGYLFRGGGLIQLTGRAAYMAEGFALNLALVDHPELIIEPANAANSACRFWVTHGCNELADTRNFTEITDRINGGQNGASHRLAYYDDALRYFGITGHRA